MYGGVSEAFCVFFYFRQEDIKELYDDDDDDDIDVNDCCGSNLLVDCRSAMWQFYVLHKLAIRRVLLLLLVVLYFVYFGYAMSYEFGDEGSIRLLWVTCLVIVILILSWIRRLLRPQLQQLTSSTTVMFLRRHHRHVNWFVVSFVIIFLHHEW